MAKSDEDRPRGRKALAEVFREGSEDEMPLEVVKRRRRLTMSQELQRLLKMPRERAMQRIRLGVLAAIVDDSPAELLFWSAAFARIVDWSGDPELLVALKRAFG